MKKYSRYDHLNAVVSYLEKVWYPGEDLAQLRVDAVHSVSKKHDVRYQTVLSCCTRGFHRTAEELDDWLEQRLKGPTPTPSHTPRNPMAEVTLEKVYEKLLEMERKIDEQGKKIDDNDDRTEGRLAAIALNILEIKQDIKALAAEDTPPHQLV